MVVSAIFVEVVLALTATWLLTVMADFLRSYYSIHVGACPIKSLREHNRRKRRSSDGIAHEFIRNLQQRGSPDQSTTSRSSNMMTRESNTRS